MRKPSPISTSWPRQTSTSPPRAVAASGEQHRGGVVVDDERVLGAGDGAERVVDVVLARGALAARQAVLEVGVAGRRP